jgi:hypothetical protein
MIFHRQIMVAMVELRPGQLWFTSFGTTRYTYRLPQAYNWTLPTVFEYLHNLQRGFVKRSGYRAGKADFGDV